MRFEGKRVLVTGAASGIGAATVDLFRSEGASVVGVDIVARDDVARCDVSDPASVQQAVAAAVERSSAGSTCAATSPASTCSRSSTTCRSSCGTATSGVNLTGPLLVTQAAVPHLRTSRGNVVTVASISGIQGQPYNSAYCASKGGLILLMKSLAVELATDGIRVNCVCPGGVDTPLSAGAIAPIIDSVDLVVHQPHGGRAPRASRLRRRSPRPSPTWRRTRRRRSRARRS